MIYNIALDIGSKYTGLSLAGSEKLLREPSVVALDSTNDKPLAFGITAVNLAKRDASHIRLVSPVNEGCIKDRALAKELIGGLINKLLPKTPYEPNVKVRCAVPNGIGTADKRAIESLLAEIGTGETEFIEAGLAASRYVFPRYKANCGMIVDIGYAKADISLIYNNKLINGCCVSLGGKHVDYVVSVVTEADYGLAVTPEMAEHVKESCVSLAMNDVSTAAAYGVRKENGSYDEERVTAADFYEGACEVLENIAFLVNGMYNSIEDELTLQATRTAGVFLCGGSARLYAVDKFFANYLEVPVRIPKECDLAVLKGIL